MKEVNFKPVLDCLRQSATLVKTAIAALTRVPHFSKQYESRSFRFVESVEKLCATNLPPLDRPLEVALCGAFSSGKSSLINALLGNSYCPTHRHVTTKQCTCFVYGEKESIVDAAGHCWTFEDYQQRVKAEDGCQFTIALPNELLKQIHIWDVPGLNAADKGETDEIKSRQICAKSDCVVYLTREDADDNDFKTLVEIQHKDVIVILPQCDKSDGAEQRYEKLCNDLNNHEDEFKKQDSTIVKVLFCGGFNPKNPCVNMRDASINKIKKALLELYVATQKRKEHETLRLLADIGKMAKICQKDILWFNERMAEWRRLLADEKSRFDKVAKLLNPEAVVDTAHDNLEEKCRDLLRDVQNSDNTLTVSGKRFRKKNVSVNIELVASLRNSNFNSYIVGVLCRELHVDELPASNMKARELVKGCCDSILDLLEASFRQYEEEARSLSLEASVWTTKLMKAGKKELEKWYKSKSDKLGKRLREDDIVNHLKSLAQDLSNMVETHSASRRWNLAQLDFFESTLAGAEILLEELQDLKGA